MLGGDANQLIFCFVFGIIVYNTFTYNKNLRLEVQLGKINACLAQSMIEVSATTTTSKKPSAQIDRNWRDCNAYKH